MIRLSPRAQADVDRLAGPSPIDAPRDPLRFLQGLYSALEFISDFPKAAPELSSKRARRKVFAVGAGRYLIDYRLEEDGDIVVLRVWHARQNRPV